MQHKQHRPLIPWLRRPQQKPTVPSSPYPPGEGYSPPSTQLKPQTPNPKTRLPPWKRLPRRLPYWLLGLGVATLVALAFRPTPIAVDLGQVQRGPLQVTVDAEGKTRVRNRFTIAAPVAGRLARIDLDPGDPVQSGAVVARIDPLPLTTKVKEAQARLQELRAQLAGVETQRPKSAALAQAQAQIRVAIAAKQQAEARLADAKAALAQATRDRKRAQDLEVAGAQTRKVREDAELAATQRQQELEVAQKQVQGAISTVAAAQKAFSVLKAEQQDPDYLLEVYRAQISSTESTLVNLADEARRTVVRAPVGGKVFRVLQESARFIPAGEPLLELGDARQLELVIDVLSTDAVKVKPGAFIQVDHWGGPHTLQAQVRYVEPSAFTEVSALGVEEQRVNIIADFIPPPRSLGDGYRVEARIVVWEDKDALKVPVSALFRCENQKWCAFVAEQGKAQRRQVIISQRSQREAAVKKGLEVGEKVILHPTEQIKANQRIHSRS
ncbi:efflux RND transporter periplasmic adaptor subunit [Acaryochloris marina]|uniref:efflux RND transporter periplasmic adaptor subunit n=1 Tax=Acaryochloris marina TaxID=155978 RepID=UPI0005A2CD32|nr:HlyD family efflux transporter periplasmic adaptor subunit [Acaryochloris marina]